MNPRLRQVVNLAFDYGFVSVCVLVVLVAGGVGYFLRQSIAGLEQEHSIVRDEGEEALKIIAGAGIMRNDRRMFGRAMQEINANLITEENLADNLGYFYKFEDQSHARISELHQLASAVGSGGGGYKTVPFSVNVTGTFGQVTSFLHQLEHGPRLMKITAFSFNRRIPTGDAVVLELNLEILARP